MEVAKFTIEEHLVTATTFGDGAVLPAFLWVSGVAPWPLLFVWVTAEVLFQATEKNM